MVAILAHHYFDFVKGPRRIIASTTTPNVREMVLHYKAFVSFFIHPFFRTGLNGYCTESGVQSAQQSGGYGTTLDAYTLIQNSSRRFFVSKSRRQQCLRLFAIERTAGAKPPALFERFNGGASHFLPSNAPPMKRSDLCTYGRDQLILRAYPETPWE